MTPDTLEPQPVDLATLEKEMLQFAGGTNTWTRFSQDRPDDLITDGVVFLGRRAKAAGLLSTILILQSNPKVHAARDFQVWKFENLESGPRLVMEDGNHNQVLKHVLDFTECLLPSFELWVQPNDARSVTMLLPSEY